MFIDTERLIICDLAIDMAKDIRKNSLDEDNKRFMPDEVFETLKEARDVVKYLMSQYVTNDGPLLHPIFNRKRKNVGYVELCPIDEGWEIGYHIAEKYTKKGYATEAVSAFLPVIAKRKGLTEIYGISLKENVASIRVLEKCGFETVFEGVGQYQGKQREIVKKVWRFSEEKTNTGE